MAILNKDEYINTIHLRLGSDNSDDAIKFLEDMVDTYNDLETKAKGDGENWEQKYRELDEAWKARYKHRFITGISNLDTISEEEKAISEEERAEKIKIDELFITEEEK